MALEKLAKEEALAVEGQIDASFESSLLPTQDLHTARWILCLAGEDAHRFALVKAAKIWHQDGSRSERAQFIARLDRYKYSLRSAFDLCSRRLPKTDAYGPLPSNAENYTAAMHLLTAAGEYAEATRVFSAYHVGTTELLIDRDSGSIEPAQEKWLSKYGTLEFLLGADRGEFSAVIHMVALFSGPDFDIPALEAAVAWGPSIHEIVRRARLVGRGIRYQLITNFAKDLFDDLNVAPAYPSKEWRFPWAGMKDAQRYFAALQATCLYHLLSIHFGAGKHHLQRIGVDQICLCADAKHLNNDICRISGVPQEIVEQITTALTLGHRTDTPDPALQPLVPIGNRSLAVPGILVMSSNWSRNMLSLHARVSPETFDADSAVFEQEMIASIVAGLPACFAKRSNFVVPTPNGGEEVDLVLVDERDSSIVICELRWMLQPGDVREVLNRRKVIKEKVAQARRKIIGARSNIQQLLGKLELEQERQWTVNGLVVIDGYGGSPSDFPNEVPVVPREIFMKLLESEPHLDHAHAVLCSPLWLPMEGPDYLRHIIQAKLCGVSFNRVAFEMGPDSYMLGSLPNYLFAALKHSALQLRSMPW